MMIPQVLKNSSFLDYRNEEVLSHFSSIYDLSEEEIEELFQETKNTLQYVLSRVYTLMTTCLLLKKCGIISLPSHQFTQNSANAF